MKPSRLLLIVVCLLAPACDQDPARSVKIIPRPPLPESAIVITPPTPPKPVVTAHAPTPAAVPGQMEFCPVPPESTPGPGDFVAKGPCNFQHRTPVSCEPSKDDFTVALSREAKLGATLVTFLNVERYHGPGDYEGAEMFVTLQSGSTMYRWSNDKVSVTVGPGEAFAIVHEAGLKEEPLLINCTNVLGPASNYQYQCQGRGYIPENTQEIVSGKLQCAESKKE